MHGTHMLLFAHDRGTHLLEHGERRLKYGNDISWLQCFHNPAAAQALERCERQIIASMSTGTAVSALSAPCSSLPRCTQSSATANTRALTPFPSCAGNNAFTSTSAERASSRHPSPNIMPIGSLCAAHMLRQADRRSPRTTNTTSACSSGGSRQPYYAASQRRLLSWHRTPVLDAEVPQMP